MTYKNKIISSVALGALLVGSLAGGSTIALAQQKPLSLEDLFGISDAPPARPPEPTIVEPVTTLPKPTTVEAPKPSDPINGLENLLQASEPAPTPTPQPAMPEIALPRVQVSPPVEPISQIDPELAKLLQDSEQILLPEEVKPDVPLAAPTPITPQPKPKAATKQAEKPAPKPAATPTLPSQRLPSQRIADSTVEPLPTPVFDPEVDVFAPPADTVTLYEEGPRGRGFTNPQAQMTFEPERVPAAAFAPMKNALLMRLEFVPYHSILPPYGEQALKPMVDLLKQNPDMVITLLGYADFTEKGSLNASRHIAGNRTKSVADFLIMHGVRSAQLHHETVGLDMVMGVPRDRVDVRFRELISTQ
jgi:outer membrane protein OmpA-like peptidoglycan-associated protein